MTNNKWFEKQNFASKILYLINKIESSKGIEISIFGKIVSRMSIYGVLDAFWYARNDLKIDIQEKQVVEGLKALENIEIKQAHIDIGKIVWQANQEKVDILAKLNTLFKGFNSLNNDFYSNIVLLGFGRIGRLIARQLIYNERKECSMNLKAVLVRNCEGEDLYKRAHLLNRDSIHGGFNGEIEVDLENNQLIANSSIIKFIDIGKHKIEAINLESYGIKNALLVDSTGIHRQYEKLKPYLNIGGIEKILLTAPGKNMKNIVYGVNNNIIDPQDKIISAASCTTNAIAPVLCALDEKYEVISGHIETVHAYTNDQNLIDNYHKGYRRGRSALLNLVITETGAVKAIGTVYPKLAGKLSGNAIRVPIANVSLAIMHLNLGKSVNQEDLNKYLIEVSNFSRLQKQIEFCSNPEAVSSDFIGSRSTAIIDGNATICNNNSIIIYVWYDNEWGYACQVIRIMRQITNTVLKVYP